MDFSKYKYVDFASALQRQPKFRNNVVPVESVSDLLRRYRDYECYSTYFLYSDDILDYLKKHTVNGHPSVSGYRGSMYAHYLPIDIDAKDLAYAKDAALAAREVIQDQMGISAKGMKIYFSGNKGFHFMIDSRAFGAKPSERMHLHFAEMRKAIAGEMPAYGETIDHQIKDGVRLWRLPNTRNAKSGLFKIQLISDELEGSIGEIRDLAKEQRPLWDTDRTGLLPMYDLSPSSEACDLYKDAIEKADARQKRTLDHYAPRINSGMCDAKQRIYNSHIEQGERNNCAIILASHFRNEGKSEPTTQEMMSEWNARNSIGLAEYELANVVKSAYRSTPYDFGCSSLAGYCPYHNRSKCRMFNGADHFSAMK